MKAIRLSYKEILDILSFDRPRDLDFKKNIDFVYFFQFRINTDQIFLLSIHVRHRS